MENRTLVLGVIGVDTHIFGNWILKYALEKAGFKVINLGAAVSQKDLINAAIESDADAILVSSLVGHAGYDCAGFRQACNEAGLKDTLLYIGGYLVVGEQPWASVEKQFKELGFDRAYPPGTTPAMAIADLNRDLALKAAPRGKRPAGPAVVTARQSVKMDLDGLRNKRITDDEFLERRKDILKLWPTGSEVDLEEAIAYHQKLPESKVFSKVVDKARREGWRPVEVQGGHATVEQCIRHIKVCEESGLDLMYLSADSFTKALRFEEAQRGIEESIKQGKSKLNGFPYVSYGVKGTRRIVESIGIPLQINAVGFEEPMLLAEISIAGGGTCNSSAALREMLVLSKNYPLNKRIQNMQYNSKLAAYYTERGAPIELTVSTAVHAYVPGGPALAIGILQCLLDAEQGVKYITIKTPILYNAVYDAAMIKSARVMAEEYLARFGYKGVRLLVAPNPWQGQWPSDEYRACAMVASHVTICTLGGTDWLHIRSIHEGVGIPSPEASAAAVRIAKQLALVLANQKLPETEELNVEARMLQLETRAILDRVIELGGGDVAVGQVRAIEQGVLDIPMSPWNRVAGRSLPVKDRAGILRWLDPGNLPVPKEALDYQRQKIAEREKAESRKADVDMLIEDIFGFAKKITRETVAK